MFNNQDYLYSLTTYYVLFMDLTLAIFLLQVLRMSKASVQIISIVATIFAVWLVILYAGISTQSLFPEQLGGAGLFSILITLVVVVSALLLFTPINKTLRKIPQELMLLPQGMRIFFGAGFLVEATLGIMPAYFGIADGLTHVTAAFLALLAAVVYAKGYSRKLSPWIANVFGLTDIVIVAFGISFILLEDIGIHHNVMYAAFFAAPLFIGFHMLSIQKLILNRQSEQAA